MNFTPSPNSILTKDRIAVVETANVRLGVEEANKLRMEVCSVIRRLKASPSNSSKQQ